MSKKSSARSAVVVVASTSRKGSLTHNPFMGLGLSSQEKREKEVAAKASAEAERKAKEKERLGALLSKADRKEVGTTKVVLDTVRCPGGGRVLSELGRMQLAVRLVQEAERSIGSRKEKLVREVVELGDFDLAMEAMGVKQL